MKTEIRSQYDTKFAGQTIGVLPLSAREVAHIMKATIIDEWCATISKVLVYQVVKSVSGESYLLVETL